MKTEYNFAVASAQMAAKWAEIMEDADICDVQFRTAGDSLVRADHAALNGITLPPTDSFWSKYLPPLDWGCRCTVVQVRKDKYPLSDQLEAMSAGEVATGTAAQKMFRFNPYEAEAIFPPKHPYFKAGKQVGEVIDEIYNEKQIAADEKIVNKMIGDFKKSDFTGENAGKLKWFEHREEFANKFGLSLVERAATTEYTRGYSADINKKFYDDKKHTKKEQAYIRTLNRALEKLPNYEGTVYRGVGAGKISKKRLSEYAEAFKNGGTITENAFLSTSRNKRIDKTFGEGVTYEIKSKTGKDIEKLSTYNKEFRGHTEEEVLFKTDTKFKVINYVENADGKIRIF